MLSHLPQNENVQKLRVLLEKAGVYSNWLQQNLNESWNTPIDAPEPNVKDGSWAGFKCFFPLKKKFENQPKLLQHELQKHQIKGYRWLVSLFENGLHGILADEMGLGKTITSIAFIAHLRQLGVFGNVLIVSPLSVLDNWMEEVVKWAPLPVIRYHGPVNERKETIGLISKAPDWAKPIILTTYDVCLKDSKLLNKLGIKVMIVDEGHRLKNVNGKLLKELKKINTDMRLLLTGTPLQNNLTELWSLLNFCLPTIFTSLEEFESWFDFDLTQELDQTTVDKLHTILQPFMLRRVKVDVCQDMPPKKEFLIYCGTTPLQDELIQACRDGSLSSFLAKRGIKISTNNLLLQERKAANHPALFKLPTSPEDAGKMRVLEKFIPMLLQKGHEVLIFSQWVETMNILAEWLESQDMSYSRLDGTMSKDERAHEISNFNRGSTRIFLLSTRAGGLGLNLAKADTVIFYDSDYNPQADAQASCRAHRIGQTRPVAVYRLCTKGTVEEDVVRRGIFKKKLEVVVMKGTEELIHEEDYGVLIDKAWDDDLFIRPFESANPSEIVEDSDEDDEGDDEGEASELEQLEQDGLVHNVLQRDQLQQRGEKRKRK